jgi:hypothetical protein
MIMNIVKNIHKKGANRTMPKQSNKDSAVGKKRAAPLGQEDIEGKKKWISSQLFHVERASFKSNNDVLWIAWAKHRLTQLVSTNDLL